MPLLLSHRCLRHPHRNRRHQRCLMEDSAAFLHQWLRHSSLRLFPRLMVQSNLLRRMERLEMLIMVASAIMVMQQQ